MAPMVAPNFISLRRFQQPLRDRLQLAFARGWEALTDAHAAEAGQFVRRLRARMSADEALQRYFREVAVPALMQETVRARALLSVADLVAGQPLEEPAGEVLPYYRPDLMLDALKRRAQTNEELNLACRLAAAMAEEVVCQTHVANAIETAELLKDAMPLDEAVMHYIRSFAVPSSQAQMVFQRALARIGEGHPLFAAEPAPAAGPTLAGGRTAALPTFGLRAIG